MTRWHHPSCTSPLITVEYETASYTWGGETGDSTLCKPVLVGPSCDVLLQTRNCWELLRYLRPWRGEREEQVAKMRVIYERAVRVVVYLGPDLVPPTSTSSPHPRRCYLDQLDYLVEKLYLPSPSDNPMTLAEVLKRRYFRRLCIIQELLLSRQMTLRVGNVECSIDQVVVKYFQDHPALDGSTLPWAKYITQRAIRDEHGNDLLAATNLTRRSRASDPRDQVFGVLGLTAAVHLASPNNEHVGICILYDLNHHLAEFEPEVFRNIDLPVFDVCLRVVNGWASTTLPKSIDDRPWHLDASVDRDTGALTILIVLICHLDRFTMRKLDVFADGGWYTYVLRKGHHTESRTGEATVICLRTNVPNLDTVIEASHTILVVLPDNTQAPRHGFSRRSMPKLCLLQSVPGRILPSEPAPSRPGPQNERPIVVAIHPTERQQRSPSPELLGGKHPDPYESGPRCRPLPMEWLRKNLLSVLTHLRRRWVTLEAAPPEMDRRLAYFMPFCKQRLSLADASTPRDDGPRALCAHSPPKRGTRRYLRAQVPLVLHVRWQKQNSNCRGATWNESGTSIEKLGGGIQLGDGNYLEEANQLYDYWKDFVKLVRQHRDKTLRIAFDWLTIFAWMMSNDVLRDLEGLRSSLDDGEDATALLFREPREEDRDIAVPGWDSQVVSELGADGRTFEVSIL
ncbi:hypothetical protein ACJZ2D_004878 [Fusarium nematophilum]